MDSRPGVGSTFWFRLPFACDHAAPGHDGADVETTPEAGS
jgi:hypothetical protein